MQEQDDNFLLFQNRYKNRKFIGSGGFAQVYKVFDHAKNHYVALKIADVRPEWKKFTLKNEVELVNRLPEHPNIARYDSCYRFDTGITGEKDFAILKFYESGNLKQFLKEKRHKVTFEDRQLIIRGILDGIAFLHSENIIHRDLKAENILMNREDGIWRPKITDFGLSREVIDKATIVNSSIGISYAYAAPEQIQNSKIQMNVDLWAMGVIIYFILTEELPFRGRHDGNSKSTESQLEITRKIIALELPDRLNSIQEPYQTMIRRCLVLDPKQRVQKAEELIEIMIKGKEGNWTNDKTVPFIPAAKSQIPPKQQVSTPPVSSFEPTPVSDDDLTDVIPDKKPQPKTTPPPSVPTYPTDHTVPPLANYADPNPNPTHFIPPSSDQEEEKEPAPISNFSPPSGDQRRIKWWWVLIFLILLAGAGGTWWYLEGDAFKTPSTTIAPPPKSKPRFDDLEKRIYDVKEDKAALEELIVEIEALKAKPEHSDNYRPGYLLALTYALELQGLSRTQQQEMASQLRRALLEAANAANIGDDYEKMRSELTEDAPVLFKGLNIKILEEVTGALN